MARIAGVNLPREKRLEVALTYIYGIGQPTAQRICSDLDLSVDEKVRDLTDEEITKLRAYIDTNLEVEGELRRERSQAIKRLQEIGVLPRVRHRRGLPVNGQRTKTNARTRKGPKKTVGRGRGPRSNGGSSSPTVEGPRPPPGEKNIAIGQAHIKTSFNNTIVSLTDKDGNVIAWESAGSAGFKGSRKSTPFAAQVTADSCARKGMEHGLQKVEVFVKGPGSGRETAIRSLQAAGLEILGVKDVSPQAHNGVRPKKRDGGSDGASLGPKCKLCRREGMKLFLKGERCLTEKCAVERRSYPPGEHGRGRIKQSEAAPAARSRRRAATTVCSSGSSATTTRRPRSDRGSPARSSCACWRRASTTWSTASASPPRAQARSSSATATSR